MSCLYIMVGLPGSGKNYYIENHIRDNEVHISSDALRLELYGDEDNQEHNDIIFDTMLKRTVDALANNSDVWYNATNLNSRRRINLIKEINHRLPNQVCFCCHVFAIPFNICCERNNERARTVPQYAMERMYKNFQAPFYGEGWDSIIVHTHESGYEQFINEMERLKDMPHDNPNHSLSIGEHMKAAARAAIFLNFKTQIKEVARIHDVGKGYCKVFHDAKGKPTEIAHYYGHANVGAYMYMCSLNEGHVSHRDAENAALITFHMDHFAGEGRIKNLSKIYPEKFLKKLEKLNAVDRLGH